MNLIRAAFVFVVISFFIPACHEQDLQTELVAPARDEELRRFVENLRNDVDHDLEEMTQTIAVGTEIANILSVEAQKPWRERVRGGIKYADLLLEVYRQHNFHIAFANGKGPNFRGQVVIEVVGDADTHGLTIAPYNLDKVAILTKRLKKEDKSLPPWQHVQLSPKQVDRLVNWLAQSDIDVHNEAERDKIISAMLGYNLPDESGQFTPLQDPPLPELDKEINTYIEGVRKEARNIAMLELRLADAALRYGRDMKHFNLRGYTWREKQNAGGSKVIIYDRLRFMLKNLFDDQTPDEVEMTFRILEPTHEQYQKLRRLLARYKKIEKEGGWPRVARIPISLHARGPEIETFRRRLEIEGYIGPTPNERDKEADPELAVSIDPNASNPFKTVDRDMMDKELMEGASRYAVTHQFAKRDFGRGFWQSINVPVKNRIRLIRLALDRVRDFAYRGEPNYIYVNIPDFYGEVWWEGERIYRFPVVVGNAKKKCNERTLLWEMPNATPVQDAQLKYIIFNPYWNVPKRIVEDEILPAMERDETFLERRGYELLSSKPGRERVRQKPGPRNALGKVKFIFPNRFNTYMHDTPHKQYFNPILRAYSHGCVRVQDPLDFAALLLEKLTDKDREWMDKVVEKEDTVTVPIKKDLPVYFEYATVRVDEHGRANFLADIYDYDADAFGQIPASAKKCFVPKEDEKGKGDPDDLGP